MSYDEEISLYISVGFNAVFGTTLILICLVAIRRCCRRKSPEKQPTEIQGNETELSDNAKRSTVVDLSAKEAAATALEDSTEELYDDVVLRRHRKLNNKSRRRSPTISMECFPGPLFRQHHHQHHHSHCRHHNKHRKCGPSHASTTSKVTAATFIDYPPTPKLPKKIDNCDSARVTEMECSITNEAVVKQQYENIGAAQVNLSIAKDHTCTNAVQTVPDGAVKSEHSPETNLVTKLDASFDINTLMRHEVEQLPLVLRHSSSNVQPSKHQPTSPTPQPPQAITINQEENITQPKSPKVPLKPLERLILQRQKSEEYNDMLTQWLSSVPLSPPPPLPIFELEDNEEQRYESMRKQPSKIGELVHPVAAHAQVEHHSSKPESTKEKGQKEVFSVPNYVNIEIFRMNSPHGLSPPWSPLETTPSNTPNKIKKPKPLQRMSNNKLSTYTTESIHI